MSLWCISGTMIRRIPAGSEALVRYWRRWMLGWVVSVCAALQLLRRRRRLWWYLRFWWTVEREKMRRNDSADECVKRSERHFIKNSPAHRIGTAFERMVQSWLITTNLVSRFAKIRYDTIDDLHWKTDRQAACQFNLAHELKENKKCFKWN